jgi:hypothetical protein
MKYKIRLINEDSTKWLYRSRIEEQFKNTIKSTTTKEEWCNIKKYNKQGCK